MEENNKLFVFEKKEVILIFLFIILIAVISFTLGVRTGKQLSLKHDDYTKTDVQNINLKSVDEEYVDSVVEPEKNDFEASMNNEVTSEPTNTDSEMEQRLKEEMEKLASEKADTATKVEAPKEEATPVVEEPKNNYEGKYTIQLFSHQSAEAAQEFADVFKLKGYDVIINEVVIPGKGKWYRVSVGIFNTVNDAKEYLDKEKALFQDQNYLIQQI